MPFPKKQGLYDPNFERDSCGVGFVCKIDGQKSYDIIEKGIEVLIRLSHRGATGADPNTGDGAGILIQLPKEFFTEELKKIDVNLPQNFAVGMVFLPTENESLTKCEKIIEQVTKSFGNTFLGFRTVPIDDTSIGKTAKKTLPIIKQFFVLPTNTDGDEFEKKLFLIRKKIENKVSNSKISQKEFFYICSLSSKVIVYKGLLKPEQLKSFYLDLSDNRLKSAICLVHSRYSTNTFPTWDLAQPFRYLAHNGEINTLRGNINWTKAREKNINCKIFDEDLKNLLPIITEGKSDSAALDNMLEFLYVNGRSLAHSMMMLIPPAWEKNSLLDKKIRDFFEYISCIMEPWDGPAAVAFTDGRFIGGILDRNGLRPCRYIITKDGLVVLASEVGVLDIPLENIAESGRLTPGKIFLVDTQNGEIVKDEKIKQEMASQFPFGKWLKENILNLKDILPTKEQKQKKSYDLETFLRVFGYTREDERIIIKPMVEKGEEPVGSMGNDTPLAVLSKKPQLLFNYFKQLFAQVTNPPIDPIREEIVMSYDSYLGPQYDLLEENPLHCRKLKIKNPILTNSDLRKLKSLKNNFFKPKVLDFTFKAQNGKLKKAIEELCTKASNAIKSGYNLLILSDRKVNKTTAPMPSLLALAALNSYLIKRGERTKVGIIIETAEAREVMHFALLFGYGADCINPYLAFDIIENFILNKEVSIENDTAQKNYIKAIQKGILKVLSKMGISKLQSYKGAQIFEAVGLGEEVINNYFPGTTSRIGGIGIDEIEKEVLLRHKNAFEKKINNILDSGGIYQWRKDGEYHLWNPDSIFFLQQAARNKDMNFYKKFCDIINNQKGHNTTLRSLLKFRKTKPIDISLVEPAEQIIKRFVTGAMSFGSISKEAHETIAIAMNRLGGKSNTGEGGEDPSRFVLRPNGDNVRSAIKQVASGRFGVSCNYLVNADEIQIKIAQGAKPGEGGQLPGHKVDKIIAKIRYSTPGITLISPPPHHDIYSIEDLAQLIFDLKNVNPKARISVKLVSEVGVGTVAAGVAKGHADMILISGGDGGTGASPLSSIKHAGLPWELGLAETHQTLVLNDLRDRVALQTDGQMRTGKDVVIAAILGAEEYGFCTSILVVLGCVLLRHCHLNNCSLGIATQNEDLRKRFAGKPEHIENYLYFVAEEVREIMAQLGVRTLNELIGRVDLLEVDKEMLDWKTRKLDFSKILFNVNFEEKKNYKCIEQDHGIENVLDTKLIKELLPYIEKKEKIQINTTIKNSDRSVGAMLSGKVVSLFGEKGLPDDTVRVVFEGIAGQSFGAFLANGITFELKGLANDYVGKGMSGGKIIIYPNCENFDTQKNIVIGNTTFYGATSGEAYIRGVAGERFCIRNSGIYAVVEGVGDHGCEYMTGGRVLILGNVGRNFAAGMSGGIAYVYTDDKYFYEKCNTELVDIEKAGIKDESILNYLLVNHFRNTNSLVAKKILDNFEKEMKKIIKVIPKEYKRILLAEETKVKKTEGTFDF